MGSCESPRAGVVSRSEMTNATGIFIIFLKVTSRICANTIRLRCVCGTGRISPEISSSYHTIISDKAFHLNQFKCMAKKIKPCQHQCGAGRRSRRKRHRCRAIPDLAASRCRTIHSVQGRQLRPLARRHAQTAPQDHRRDRQYAPGRHAQTGLTLLGVESNHRHKFRKKQILELADRVSVMGRLLPLIAVF